MSSVVIQKVKQLNPYPRARPYRALVYKGSECRFRLTAMLIADK